MFTITNSPLAESLNNSIWEEQISRNAITLLKYVNIFFNSKNTAFQKSYINLSSHQQYEGTQFTTNWTSSCQFKIFYQCAWKNIILFNLGLIS